MEGYTPPPGQELQVDIRIASADYFQTMEIPLKTGDFSTKKIRPTSRTVAIIDEKFAQRFWPNGDAVGKHVCWFDPKKPMTIVGVVGVVKQYGLDTDGKIAAYFPHQQYPDPRMFLVARTATEGTGLSSAIVGQIHAVDPDAVVYDIRSMQERLYVRWRDSVFRAPCWAHSRCSRCFWRRWALRRDVAIW